MMIRARQSQQLTALLLGLIGFAAQAADDEAMVISRLDQEWTAAINMGDPDTVAHLFSEEGRIFPPNAPPIVGRDAIRSYADGLSKLTDISFETTPDTIEISAAGDYAFLTGQYRLGFGPKDQRFDDVGKYVVIWRKKDGHWRVVLDTFNSNSPR